MSNKEIAGKLNIATFTVKSHVHNILEKLALHSRFKSPTSPERKKHRSSTSTVSFAASSLNPTRKSHTQRLQAHYSYSVEIEPFPINDLVYYRSRSDAFPKEPFGRHKARRTPRVLLSFIPITSWLPVKKYKIIFEKRP